jgi:hypothetical protein
MTVQEIKRAVDAGKPVVWASPSYAVIRDRIGQYLIKCVHNGSCIGLTHADGVTLNGKECAFWINE